MKKSIVSISALVLVAAALTALPGLRAASESGQLEYVTLRWDGRDYTHIIRPNGTVEHLAAQFSALRKPQHTDDRSFYMNQAMNSLAREGYELVAMTSEDYVFKRTARP